MTKNKDALEALDVVDERLAGYQNAKETIRTALQSQPEVVTVMDFIKILSFSPSITKQKALEFADLFKDLYPNGLKIIEGEA